MSRLLCIFLWSVAGISYAQPTAKKQVITLRADNWCPYNCDPKSDKPGYMIEISKAVFAKAGYIVEYETLNWARSIADTRKGLYSGIVGAAKSDAPDFVFPEVPLGVNKNCFYTKTSSKFTYDGVTSLEKIRLGVTRDYAYSDEVDPYIKQNQKDPKRIDVVSGDTPLEANIKKVSLNRIDAFLENDFVTDYFRSTSKNKFELREAGCVKPDFVYVAFSPSDKRSAEFAKMLTEGFKEMRRNGTLKVLLARYGIVDWQ